MGAVQPFLNKNRSLALVATSHESVEQTFSFWVQHGSMAACDAWTNLTLFSLCICGRRECRRQHGQLVAPSPSISKLLQIDCE